MRAFGIYEAYLFIRYRGWLKKYRNTTELLIRHEGLEVKVFTDTFYTKKYFYPKINNGHIHEPQVLSLVNHILPEDGVFYDIGAHLGYFSCFAGKRAHRGEIHTFEMNAELIDPIRRNLRLNGLEERVHVNHCAVADHSGTVKYEDKSVSGPGMGYRPSATAGVEVVSTTLDEYVQKVGSIPHIVKIDVEGAELRVLEGMRSLLNLVDHLIIEVHPGKMGTFSDDYRMLMTMIMEKGYLAYVIEGHKDGSNQTLKLYQVRSVPERTKTFMVYASKVKPDDKFLVDWAV